MACKTPKSNSFHSAAAVTVSNCVSAVTRCLSSCERGDLQPSSPFRENRHLIFWPFANRHVQAATAMSEESKSQSRRGTRSGAKRPREDASQNLVCNCARLLLLCGVRANVPIVRSPSRSVPVANTKAAVPSCHLPRKANSFTLPIISYCVPPRSPTPPT
jgi:hypothetical protein